MRRKRIWQVGVLSLVLVAVAPAAAPAAEPVYVQYACHLPDGTPAPADGFVPSNTGGMTTENRCASGGGLTMTVPVEDVASSSAAAWTYKAREGTDLVGLALTRTVANVAGNDQANRMWLLKLDGEVLDGCSFWGACEATKKVESNLTGRILGLELHCPGTPCRGPASGPGVVSVDGIALTLRDAHPPVLVDRPSGDLFDGSASGVRHVTVSASDVGGGVFTAQLVVDNVPYEPQVLDINGGACAKPFVAAVPCPGSATGTLELDTTRLDDGPHVLSVVVTDATEVNRAVSDELPFTVANPRPESTDSSIAAPPAATGHRVAGRPFRRGMVRQTASRSRTIHGRVVEATGAPSAHVQLSVFAALAAPGGAPRLIGSVTTDDAGRFTFRIPKGPSRVLTFAIAGSSSPIGTLRVSVPAPLRLSASRDRVRNGERLFLTARLLRNRVPAGSADVAFQVRIGKQWRTFATRPLSDRGRARIGHRFTVTFHRMTYRFRAIIVGRRTFPFGNATTRVVAVRVN